MKDIRQEKVDEEKIRHYMSMREVKKLKKSLPKDVTFLSMYTDHKGEHSIKAVVNKKSYYFSVPDGLYIRKAEAEVLSDLIRQKI